MIAQLNFPDHGGKKDEQDASHPPGEIRREEFLMPLGLSAHAFGGCVAGCRAAHQRHRSRKTRHHAGHRIAAGAVFQFHDAILAAVMLRVRPSLPTDEFPLWKRRCRGFPSRHPVVNQSPRSCCPAIANVLPSSSCLGRPRGFASRRAPVIFSTLA